MHKPEIPTISRQELISLAGSSDQHQEQADFLIDNRKSAIRWGDFPSREALTKRGLTESQWLVYSGLFRQIPGGGASPLALELLKYHLSDLSIRDQKISVFLGIHTSDVPCATTEELLSTGDRAFTKAAYSYPRATPVAELDIYHAHTNCGLTGRASETRSLAARNRAEVMKYFEQKATDGNLNIQSVDVVEALIQRGPSPQWHQALGEEATVGFYINPGNIPCTMDEPDTRAGSGMTYHDLNDNFRKLMDHGILPIGIGCIDIRQTLTHANHVPASAELASRINPDHAEHFRYLEHTEFPLGVLLTDSHNFYTLTVLSFMDSLPKAIQRRIHGSVDISQAATLIMSAPDQFMKNHAHELHTAVSRLISNLNQAVYNMAHGFVEIEGKVYRLTGRGVQVAYYNDHSGTAEEVLVAGRPFITAPVSATRGNYTNPEIRKFLPFTKRHFGIPI